MTCSRGNPTFHTHTHTPTFTYTHKTQQSVLQRADADPTHQLWVDGYSSLSWGGKRKTLVSLCAYKCERWGHRYTAGWICRESGGLQHTHAFPFSLLLDFNIVSPWNNSIASNIHVSFMLLWDWLKFRDQPCLHLSKRNSLLVLVAENSTYWSLGNNSVLHYVLHRNLFVALSISCKGFHFTSLSYFMYRHIEATNFNVFSLDCIQKTAKWNAFFLVSEKT